MCLSVQAITFELVKLGTSILVYRYILTTFRSSLSIKVIGSRSNEKLTYFDLPVSSVCLYAIMLVKRSRSSQGEIQGYTVSRSNEGKSIFCPFANAFVICVMWMVHLQLKGILVWDKK